MTTSLADETHPAENAVLGLHNKFVESGKSKAPLASLNKAAIERFEELKFPHRKHEMYTFVNTQDLASTAFELPGESSVTKTDLASHVYAGCEKSHLVFVDGAPRLDLSDVSALGPSLKISPLEEAVLDSKVSDYVLDTIENDNDVFASINSAFMEQGLVLEVQEKAQLETPLQILFVSTGSESNPVMNTPRLLVRLGRMSELKAIVKYVGIRGNYFANSVQDWILEEAAGVTFSQVQADVPDAWNFTKTRIQLYRNSWFIGTDASSGGKLVRHHLDAYLKEIGAELRLNGVSVLRDVDQAHRFIRIHHEAPNCVSNQDFKNIINDKGRSSFDGTVIVKPGAQLTNADQQIKNLMLSNEGHADNKPNLMIFADDVKCAHGATVGQVDEEQLFYLKTRGFTQAEAKRLLTRSFAQSIIDAIPFPAVVDDLENTLLKKLEV